MSKHKVIRMTMGGILLATALVAGVSVYRAEQKGNAQTTAEADGIDRKVLSMPDETTKTVSGGTSTDTMTENINSHTTATVDKGTDTEETVETSGNSTSTKQEILSDVTADTKETEKTEKADQFAGNTEDKTTADTKEQTTAVSARAVSLFTADSVIGWPLEGTILKDYSMDKTVYFPTLNVYKCNPAILLKASVGDQVSAAFAGTVEECFTSEETGDTVTVDMGNGYKAVYGQLKEVTVQKGDRVTKGEVIATVADPTRYYTKEGTNLYFAMTKDGQPVDPAEYTEVDNE